MTDASMIPDALSKWIVPLGKEIGCGWGKAASETPVIVIGKQSQVSDVTAPPWRSAIHQAQQDQTFIARTLSTNDQHLILMAEPETCVARGALLTRQEWPLLWVHEVAHVALFQKMPTLPAKIAKVQTTLGHPETQALLNARAEILQHLMSRSNDPQDTLGLAWSRVQEMLHAHLGDLAEPFLWHETSEGLSRMAEFVSVAALRLNLADTPWLTLPLTTQNEASVYESGFLISRILKGVFNHDVLANDQPRNMPLSGQLSKALSQRSATDNGKHG